MTAVEKRVLVVIVAALVLGSGILAVQRVRTARLSLMNVQKIPFIKLGCSK